MSWDIKGKDNTVKATVYALEYNGEWMGESYVSVTIESPTPIAFAIGDYLMYRGERFEINYDPGKIKSAPQFAKGDAFKYENVKFNSLSDELTRCDFLDVVLGDNQLHFTGLPKFSFYGGVQDLANRIQANLNRAYPNQWTVVVSPEYSGTKELNVSVDTQKVWDALSILVNDFETYFTIKERTITIGAAGVPAGHLFKYGKGNGLYEIEQNAEADQAVVTRLRAYGSTRNLPHRYYNSLTGADGQKLIPDNMAVQYLMLPSFPYTTQDPYIDSTNIVALGIREDNKFFDGSQEGLEEIYPSIEGMTAEQLKAAGVPCNSTGALDVIVSAEQMTDDGVGDINEGETETTANPPIFKVTLKDLGFNLWDYRVAGEAPVLSFKTGMLGGRDFEIVDCKKEGNNYVLELNRVYDDSIKLWFPYKDYNAKGLQQNADNPDKFVLLHIEMPEVYIKAAAQRLLEAATAWLAKNDYSRSVYAPKVDEIFMARQHDEAIASGGSIASLHDTLKEGMLLLFEDDDLNIDASIFIDRLTIKEGDSPVPTYEVVLKEEKTVGRLDKMQNQIDSLAAGGGQGGGYSASQIRSLIDAYGGLRFLSKLKDDRSKGKIASDLGFEIGNYLAGVSGGIFGIDADNGDSFAEVARLFVRGKAYFETLTTMESKTLAGKQYISPGGSIKCTKVEELKNPNGKVIIYRCYFLSEQDGEKTETKIIAGDQAISEMFNAKTGVTNNKLSNHRYWRLVTSVNNDAYSDDADNHYGYIDLSAVDCKSDSDIPKEGDVIEQFGNRTDAARQSAMVFSTVDADAPSIKMFAGIGSGTTNSEHYSLNNKAIVSFGRDAATGKVYFRLGATDATQFLDYKQDEGLTLNGKLSVNTTIGDKTIDEYFADKAEAATDKYKYLAVALPQDTEITGGVMLSTLVSLGYTDASNIRHTLAGMNGGYVPTLGGRTIGSWWGGPMTDKFNADDMVNDSLSAGSYATSLIRMDGTGYFVDGLFRIKKTGLEIGDTANGYGISMGMDGRLTLGNGIEINIGGDAKGLADSIASVTNLSNAISNLFTPYNGTTARTWQDVLNGADFDAVKVERAFFTDFSLAGKGLSPAGGSGGGGGGSLFGLYTDTTWVSVPADDDALSAVLGKSLHARVSVLEGAGYLTAITKTMVEAVLTGDITSHTHSQYLTQHQSLADYYTKSQADTRYARQAAANNFVHNGNEVTFVPSGYSFPVWLNYRTVGGTNGAISEYRFGNGSGGAYADVRAKSFIANGGTASQILMANGTVANKVTLSGVSNAGWTGSADDDLKIPTILFLSRWNGLYNTTSSNLQYCDRGRFGTMAVANAADYTRKASLTISAGGVAKITLPNSGCLISIRGLNGGRAALVWVTGYYDGTSVRNTARIIYSSSNYSFYFNGTSESSGCVYVKSAYTSGDDTITVTGLYGTFPTLTSVSAVPSDATLIGSSDALATTTSLDPRYVNSDGDTMTGNLQMGANRINFDSLSISNAGGRLAVWSGDGNAGPFNVGSLLVSNAWADATKVPSNGIYSKGVISSGVATGTAPFTVLSSTMVSNLNAELLGGLTCNQVRSSVMRFLGTQPTATANVDLNQLVSGMARNYWDTNKWTNAPSGMGYGAAITFSQYNYDNLYGQLAWDVNHYTADVTGKLFWRAFAIASDGTNKWGGWKQIAFTDDNVASATKLQKARSIWGQNFDGTSAITGNMIHVGEFRFEAGTAVLHNATTKVYQLWAVNGINLFPTWSVNTAVLSVTPNGNVGRVGVNMFSPAYDFDVTGVIHASGEIFSDKAFAGKGMTSSSDIRLKHIVGNVELSFEAILNSPSKRFTWLGDPTKTERIGTTAQYWLPILPQVVYTAPDGYYAVDYGTLANAKADTIAHVVAQLIKELNEVKRQLKSLPNA